jgi:hypothetical protein
MAFNVQQFRAQMTDDGARPNLFQCEIQFPLNVIPDSTAANQKFTFMARAAQLPGTTVNQIPINYMGREIKVSGNRQFTEWTATIINDEDFMLKSAFERWMSGLNSHVGNLRAVPFMSPADYQTTAFITQFAKDGTIVKRYKFVGLFPVDVSPIEMDWGANDTIEEFAVTFAYQWWEADTTDGPSSPISFSPGG